MNNIDSYGGCHWYSWSNCGPHTLHYTTVLSLTVVGTVYLLYI